MWQPMASMQNRKSALQGTPVLWRQIQAFWYMGIGKLDVAVRQWIKVLNEDKGRLRFNEVRKLIRANAFQDARDYLEAVEESYPEQMGEIKYLLAQCYLGQGMLGQAQESTEAALAQKPESAEYLNLLAECHLQMGNWQEAIQCFTHSLRANPQNTEITYRLGTIYARHGAYLDALRCFQGCCQLNPHHMEYWEMKGEMQLNLDQIEQAAVSFKKALRFGVKADLSARLAYCHVQMKEIKKAVRYYELALKYEPDHFDSMTNLAAVFQNQGESPKALALLEKAHNLRSNDPILLNNMAYTLLHMGRSRKAIELYGEALKFSPDHPMILYNLAVCHARKGNWEDGIETLDHLLEMDPGHSDAWILMGNIYDQMAEPEVAIDCFNKALKLA